MTFISQLDLSFLLWIHETFRADWLTPFMKFITSFGNGGIFWVIVTLCLLIPKKTRWVGVTAGLSIALTYIIGNLYLKNAVGRIRPYDAHEAVKLLIRPENDLSFPSGHTSISFSAALIYVRMLPKKFGVPAVILATVIAFSRLYLGAHYPTDVLAGFLLALACSTLIYHLIGKKRNPYPGTIHR